MSSSEHLFYMHVRKKDGESWINEMEMFGFSHFPIGKYKTLFVGLYVSKGPVMTWSSISWT